MHYIFVLNEENRKFYGNCKLELEEMITDV